uniref:acetate--CoA ligase n=1 Tax=Lygus hesperus TaxID=30085 RepID=A0A0A9XKP1_LYGHE
MYPDVDRYWDMIERHKITKFYTSPTAIRALMRYGADPIKKHNLESLKVVGTVGEPISPEAWKWIYTNIGNSNISIVDTYWQTETGGHILTNLPGCMPMRPGSVALPFFGIDMVIMSQDGKEITKPNVPGLLCIRKPWPGMVRTCWANHIRYKQSYFSIFKGLYFTGDSGYRDEDGYYWIIGRVDDVINVSGHRIGSAEIENAISTHQGVAESAVVGVPHPIKGQALFAFVILKLNYGVITNFIQSEIMLQVSTEVGAFARPDYICIVSSLPKTRSGKIMRRLLRKIACGETEGLLQDIDDKIRLAKLRERGENEEKHSDNDSQKLNPSVTIPNGEDLSTLSNPEIIQELINQVNELHQKANK